MDATLRRLPAGLVARSRPMRALFALLERLADVDDPVLLEGETGTGKGLLARTLHALGPRGSGRFVAVNCGAIPDTLLEGELFGSSRGAYTGAETDRPGLFEAAHRGTLFLDEIEAMPEGMQKKLLRVLDEKKVRRVGALSELAVDVRIVAATNQPIRDLVARGAIRKDIYYRISGFTLRVPALRERPEDVAPLAELFLAEQAREAEAPAKTLSPEALETLERYGWPGNVRELRNELRRAALLSGEVIRRQDLSVSIRDQAALPAPRGAYRERIAEFEKRVVEEALADTGGNLAAAARALGITRATLRRKMHHYGLGHP